MGTYTIETPLDAGKYVFTGTFTGNEYYTTAASASANHNVGLYETTITITPKQNTMVRDDVIVDFEVTSVDGPYQIDGTLTVNINQQSHTVTITNGKGQLKLDAFAAGNYPFNAVFNANKYYAKSEASSSISISKYATNLEISMPYALVGDTAWIYINVISDLPNANGTVKVNGPAGNNEVTIVNGKGNFSIPNAAAGNYPITAWFVENEDYLQTVPAVEQTGVIGKYNITSIELTAGPVLYGQDLVINAAVTGNADKYPVNGQIYIVGNKDNYTINIVNGEGSISIPNLEARDYVVGATFLETDYYNKNSTSATFKVLKHNSDLTLSIEPVMVGENVTIYAHVAGNESYPVDGMAHVTGSQGTFDVPIENGVGSINISNVKAGQYIITAVFDENPIYYSSPASGLVVVNRYATEVSFSVDPIHVGETLKIYANVTSPLNNVNGTISIHGNLNDYTIDITDGEGYLEIPDLPASNYYLTGIFAQNDQYLKSNASIHIEVLKHESNVIVSAQPILVGEDLIINVNVQGDDAAQADGVVTLTINHADYEIPVTDGVGQKVISNLPANLPKTEYVIGAVFQGNAYYLRNDAENITYVYKRASQITTTPITSVVKVGDTVTLRATVSGVDYSTLPTGKIVLSGSATGEIVLDGGSGSIDITNVVAGDYIITLTYQEDANYNKSTSTFEFTVEKHDPTVTINIPETIKVDESIPVEVVLSENAEGTVVINVNGNEKTLNVENNKVTFTFDAITAAGKYDVSAVYSGDDYYNKADTKKSFEVSQYKTSVSIEAPDRTELGENVTINVTVSNLENGEIIPQGNVIIAVGGQSKTIALTDGKAQWNVSGLTVGSKIINVNYNGNNKFAVSGNSLNIAIGKHSGEKAVSIDANVEDKKVGESVTIEIELPDDATGNITFVVDGVSTVKPLVSGQTEFTIENLVARDYVVNIGYDGDENYSAADKKLEFKVDKWDIGMNVTVDGINVLDSANVTVDVIGEDGLKPTGTVTFSVAGNPYTINVVDGKGSKLVPGLAANTYKIEATFLADGRYAEFTNETSFNVNKFTPEVSVDVKDIKVLGIANVTVKVIGVNDTVIPTGKVIFSIGSTVYEITLNGSGEGYQEIEDLAADTYYITPVYRGDGNYTSRTTQTISFEVQKHDPTFTLDINEVYVGDDVIINVTVVGLEGNIPTGRVSVYMNGTLKDEEIDENGYYSFNFGKRAAETYRSVITYYGDDIYNKLEQSAQVKVNKYVPNIEIEVNDTLVLSPVEVNVTIDGERGPASGNIQIAVSSMEKDKILENGQASSTFEGLSADHWIVSVICYGDENYTARTITKGFDVIKHTPTVEISVDDINVTETAVISVKVTGDAGVAPNGIVRIYVNEETYDLNLDGKDSVTQEIPNLSSRTYNVIAIFNGDDNYAEARDTDSFDVLKFNPAFNIKVNSVYVGDNVTFIISIVQLGDVNATGEVEIAIKSLNIQEFANLTNGTLEYNLTNVPAGHYIPTIIYYGDENYVRAESSSVAFDVNKYKPDIKVEADDVMVGDEVWVNVTVSGDAKDTATGYVLINVNNVAYNVTLDNKGVARQNISGLKAKHYDISVSYLGDDNYLVDVNVGDFAVNKYDPEVSIDVNSSKVGPKTYIVINVAGNAKQLASGTAYIYVAGQSETVNVVNGVAEWTVPDFLTADSYVVEVTYNGDDNYNPTQSRESFEVTKRTPTVNITVNDIKVGEYADITIEVTGDATDYEQYATGKVEFYLNGAYSGDLENGVYQESIKLNEARPY